MATSAATTGAMGDRPGVLTVSQLAGMIRAALQRGLPSTVLVAGELSNVARPASGHLYFTLKDAGGEIRCAMWRSAASLLRFNPTDGLAVIATGTVELYEPRGQVQLYVRRLEPRGVGALELALRQLRDRLQREGLFDPRRKRALPRFPARIAVVTSPTGAALRDIVQTLRRRFPCVTLFLHPVRVQGEGAAAEIAAAIAAVNRAAAGLGGIDVLIVGRGGGSLEDLWAFNEEAVARAVFDSAIPVVSAVGHEVDVSICDLVADVRAATPTAAAELVAPSRSELLEALRLHADRLRRQMSGRLELAAARIARAAACELFRSPEQFLRRREQRVDEAAARFRAAAVGRLMHGRARLHRAEVRLARCRPEAVLTARRHRLDDLGHRLRWAQGRCIQRAERRAAATFARLMGASPAAAIRAAAPSADALRRRLAQAWRHRVERAAAALDAIHARLYASGHERVLARGFSITRDGRSGAVVTAATDVRPGQRISTQTADGTFESRVLDGRQGELFD